jgi:hypothetical protein
MRLYLDVITNADRDQGSNSNKKHIKNRGFHSITPRLAPRGHTGRCRSSREVRLIQPRSDRPTLRWPQGRTAPPLHRTLVRRHDTRRYVVRDARRSGSHRFVLDAGGRGALLWDSGK